jgi:hypothetical protein
METFDISSQTKFRTQSLVGKVMLTSFWDAEEPILIFYQARGITVNRVHYSEMLGGPAETSYLNQ